jgi:DNA modification methylase
LQSIPDKSIDLIYLDPPFFSNQTYEIILPIFDFKKLQATDGKEFEIWIVDKFGGIPNEK